MLLVGVVVCCRYGHISADTDPKFTTLFIGSTKFTVEIADTPKKQEIGMMYRESMPDDFGMLFPYKYDEHLGFWMRNCKISLDIIYLDKDKRVINIHANVPPCPGDPCKSYYSKRPARYVLELRGKRAAELGLKEGDEVFFTLK